MSHYIYGFQGSGYWWTQTQIAPVFISTITHVWFATSLGGLSSVNSLKTSVSAQVTHRLRALVTYLNSLHSSACGLVRGTTMDSGWHKLKAIFPCSPKVIGAVLFGVSPFSAGKMSNLEDTGMHARPLILLWHTFVAKIVTSFLGPQWLLHKFYQLAPIFIVTTGFRESREMKTSIACSP